MCTSNLQRLFHMRRCVRVLAASPAVVDVAVVGGGVVGMSFAAELARAVPSLRVLLIDGDAGRVPAGSAVDAVKGLPEPDLRTFAITPASVKSFGPAWKGMQEARATAFTDMQV